MKSDGVWLGILLACWWLAVGAFVAPQPAQAYLDPGTGSFVFQCLIGTVLGALVTVKLYWQRLQAHFKRAPQAHPEKTADEEAPV